MTRTYTKVLDKLKTANLRPTRQRLALAKLLLENEHRHITAEELFHEARAAGIMVSLATVYNTLHQFTSAGLLREVVVDMGQSYFDTNTSHHHHFFDEVTGKLSDIPDDHVEISRLPTPPSGQEIDRVEVIVRLRRSDPSRTDPARP
ncbi:MAG: iron response transcriptional regulator IrrA [Geminicoccaceae bacterium]